MNTNTTKTQAIRYATIEAITDYINHEYNLRQFNAGWWDGLSGSTQRSYISQTERLMCEFAGIPMKNGVVPEFVLIHKYFTRDEIELIFNAFDNGMLPKLRIENNVITCK